MEAIFIFATGVGFEATLAGSLEMGFGFEFLLFLETKSSTIPCLK